MADGKIKMNVVIWPADIYNNSGTDEVFHFKNFKQFEQIRAGIPKHEGLLRELSEILTKAVYASPLAHKKISLYMYGSAVIYPEGGKPYRKNFHFHVQMSRLDLPDMWPKIAAGDLEYKLRKVMDAWVEEDQEAARWLDGPVPVMPPGMGVGMPAKEAADGITLKSGALPALKAAVNDVVNEWLKAWGVDIS